jgi:hypothetical protein
MPPVELEPTVSAGERPHTYALDRAATATGSLINVTAVITDRSAGWNDLVVEQRVQNTDIGTCWKGAT